MKKISLILILNSFFLQLFAQKGEVLIDNFDKATGVSIPGGTWSGYTDKPNQGASVFFPADIKSAYYMDTVRNSQALKFSYKLNKGGFKWEPYISLTLAINTTQLAPGIIKAIAYDFKGSSHNLIYELEDVTDYAHYKKAVPASKEWTTVIIPFTELQQPGWGKKVEFSANDLSALDWMVMGQTGDSGTICLDNIRFLRRAPQAQTSFNVDAATLSPTGTTVQKLPDNVTIANWYGFNKAAYSLSFDDGLISHYQHVAPILEKHNLKGTFYLVTDQLTINPAMESSWRYGYWHQFKDLHKRGHEIGAHSATHPKLTGLSDGNASNSGTLQYEIISPLQQIKKHIPEAKVLTFAYPFVEYNQHVIDEVSKHYIASRALYGGVNSINPDFMALKGQIIDYGNEERFSAHDKSKMEAHQTNIEQTTIKQGGWSVYLAHDVLPFFEAAAAKDAYNPVSAETFDTFCQWLQSKQNRNELWVETVSNVSRYIKERNAVQMTLNQHEASKLTYTLTDNLADDIYNYPLSFELTVPNATWTSVSVKQGTKQTTVKVNEQKIRFDAIPDGGLVEITKLH